MTRREIAGLVGLAACVLAGGWPAAAQSGRDCSRTSVGFTPISDLGTGTHHGFEGGLYPGGTNRAPAGHLAAGVEIGRGIVPLDAAGEPSAQGRIVMISVGMSNTRQHFAQFLPMVDSFPNRHGRLTVVNTAVGGVDARRMSNPEDEYWARVDGMLGQRGLTPEQVQAAWMLQAIAGVNDPFPADALRLRGYEEQIVRILKQRFPNIKAVYISNRIYAGYTLGQLNPEPYAYQSAFAVKWLIEDQINGLASLNFDPGAGPVEAPWLAWGPDLWADGLTPRSDGLVWTCDDLASDGTHPSVQGAQKAAGMLLEFFRTDATSRPWFVACRADMNDDGVLDFFDFLEFQELFLAGRPVADCDGDGALTFFDFLCFQNEFLAGCP
jgi:hypothetical protein